MQDNVPMIRLVVCGAHMSGMALNGQLTSLGATLQTATRTAPVYRFYALAGEPKRPGLIRTAEADAHAIEVEVWQMPAASLGAFAELIPSPLCLGTVLLENDDKALGFLCEPIGIEGATEISRLGSWRAYMNSLQA